MGEIVNRPFDRITEKVLDEGKKLLWIFIYFWVLFGLFSVFRSLVLNERNLVYHEGFAVINAFLLAKVVLTAEFFQVADNGSSAMGSDCPTATSLKSCAGYATPSRFQRLT
jgi:hypothetical protein